MSLPFCGQTIPKLKVVINAGGSFRILFDDEEKAKNLVLIWLRFTVEPREVR